MATFRPADIIDDAMEMIDMKDFYNGPAETATSAYLGDYAAVQEAAEAAPARPVCAFCEGEIDPADGCYEIPVHIRGHREDVLVCDSCYNTGFEGGIHYDSMDVREFLMEE